MPLANEVVGRTTGFALAKAESMVGSAFESWGRHRRMARRARRNRPAFPSVQCRTQDSSRTGRKDALEHRKLNRKLTESIAEWHARGDQKQQLACWTSGVARIVFPATNGDFSGCE